MILQSFHVPLSPPSFFFFLSPVSVCFVGNDGSGHLDDFHRPLAALVKQTHSLTHSPPLFPFVYRCLTTVHPICQDSFTHSRTLFTVYSKHIITVPAFIANTQTQIHTYKLESGTHRKSFLTWTEKNKTKKNKHWIISSSLRGTPLAFTLTL